MRTRDRAFPHPLARHAHPAVHRRDTKSHDIEAVTHRPERLVGEKALYGGLGILVEQLNLGRRIPFGKNHHVYLLLRRTAVVQNPPSVTILPGSGALAGHPTSRRLYQYVPGIHGMRHRRDYVIVKIK